MRWRRRIPLRSAVEAGSVSGPACHAPFTSMHLDPRGHVRACCMNEWQPLGRIGDSTLREIWDGSATRRLRDALAAGSFGLGCERCGTQVEAGVGGSAYLHTFDRLAVEPGDTTPSWPRQLELALSNTCNLQCVMCNGDLSSSIRSRREGRPALPEVYDDRFFDELRDFLPHLDSVVLLGGEPFLARESLRLLDLLDELDLHPLLHVTTNGTVWNERIERLLSTRALHVAVSVDALSIERAERVRVGADHAAVLANVDRYLAASRSGGGTMSISTCLMRDTWPELLDVLRWADDRDLPVDVNLVMYPPRFSLAQAGLEELDAAIATIAADAAARPLERNAAVAAAQLDRLRALRDERAGSAAPAAGLVGGGGPPVGAAADRMTKAIESIGAGWQGTEWTTGADEMVTDLSPADSELAPLAGRPLRDLVDLLTARYGVLAHSTLSHRADGIEERALRFDAEAGSTEVRTLMVPTDDGQRWWLGVRVATPAPTATATLTGAPVDGDQSRPSA